MPPEIDAPQVEETFPPVIEKASPAPSALVKPEPMTCLLAANPTACPTGRAAPVAALVKPGQDEEPPASEASIRPKTPKGPVSPRDVVNPLAINGSCGGGMSRHEGRVTHYGYRYYDPVTGRWPSRDPIGENWATGEYNEFAFIANEPVSWIDILGLSKGSGNQRQDQFRNWTDEQVKSEYDRLANDRSKEAKALRKKLERELKARDLKNVGKQRGGGRGGPRTILPDPRLVIISEIVQEIHDHYHFQKDIKKQCEELTKAVAQYASQCRKVGDPDCWDCFCCEGFTAVDETGVALPEQHEFLEIRRFPVKSVDPPKVFCRNNRWIP
jgi:RHS repeat-associated protein